MPNRALQWPKERIDAYLKRRQVTHPVLRDPEVAAEVKTAFDVMRRAYEETLDRLLPSDPACPLDPVALVETAAAGDLEAQRDLCRLSLKQSRQYAALVDAERDALQDEVEHLRTLAGWLEARMVELDDGWEGENLIVRTMAAGLHNTVEWWRKKVAQLTADNQRLQAQIAELTQRAAQPQLTPAPVPPEMDTLLRDWALHITVLSAAGRTPRHDALADQVAQVLAWLDGQTRPRAGWPTLWVPVEVRDIILSWMDRMAVESDGNPALAKLAAPRVAAMRLWLDSLPYLAALPTHDDVDAYLGQRPGDLEPTAHELKGELAGLLNVNRSLARQVEFERLLRDHAHVQAMLAHAAKPPAPTPSVLEPDWTAAPPWANYAWLSAWSGMEVGLRWCYCAEEPGMTTATGVITGEVRQRPDTRGKWCYGQEWIPIDEVIAVYQMHRRPDPEPSA